MTIPELIDRLYEINSDLDCGGSVPKLLNQNALQNIQSSITELISDLENDGILDNEYVLDIILGVTLFIIIIFLILLANKAISKVITYTGLGSIDKVFGFFFGIAKSYILIVCLFTAIDVVYDSKKWPLNLKDSLTFPWVEKGSIYLIKVFPNQKQYEDAKEKVQDV